MCVREARERERERIEFETPFITINHILLVHLLQLLTVTSCHTNTKNKSIEINYIKDVKNNSSSITKHKAPLPHHFFSKVSKSFVDL